VSDEAQLRADQVAREAAYESWRSSFPEAARAIEDLKTRRELEGYAGWTRHYEEWCRRYPDAAPGHARLLMHTPGFIRGMRLQSPDWRPPEGSDAKPLARPPRSSELSSGLGTAGAAAWVAHELVAIEHEDESLSPGWVEIHPADAEAYRGQDDEGGVAEFRVVLMGLRGGGFARHIASVVAEAVRKDPTMGGNVRGATVLSEAVKLETSESGEVVVVPIRFETDE
jgi:hypothetical protein